MAQNGGDNHSTLQFQMPHFVLGGTPNLAHGGGAEVLPGMYGQGTHPWPEYDKYWYDQNHEAGPSKDYTLSDLVMVPPSVSGTPTGRVSINSRPFEFDPPTVVTPPSPGMPAIRLDHDRGAARVQDQRRLALSTPSAAALVPQHAMLPGPYTFPTPNFLDPTAPLPALPANGLPLYSASGFDMLRMLAKVATRPNPKIMLGPVDMTCSFVVVDIRRFDSPIVYASPTFTRLTGYSEAEVLGRNCRFLQHPSGQLQRGETRQFTAPDAVRHLHKSLLQDKECQASLINYRKGGDAFINLVTVIPISSPEDERDSESGEITHCVGFQVDLAEQPSAIMEKLRDGSYIVNYSSAGGGVAGLTGTGFSLLPGMPGPSMARERRAKGVSAEMIDMLRDARAYSGTRPGQTGDAGIKGARDNDRAELHSLLLENTDDFIHVVSLKGSLLYVAPAITRVLGYAPSDLIGKSIADLCHPADVVPLMRELKDASSGPPSHATPIPPPHHVIAGHTHTHASLFMLPASSHAQTHHSAPFSAPPPKPVNLLFRAQHKTAGGYVWLEARGRLHVEQGKGRKAIVLVGRRVDIPKLTWGAVERGQLSSGACVRESGAHDDDGYEGDDAREGDALVCGREEDECWGLVAPNGIILSACPVGAYRLGYSTPMGAAGVGASHVLTAPGDPQNLVGRSLASLVVPQESRRVSEVLAGAACVDREEMRNVRCRMSVCAPTRGNVGETSSAGSGSASEAGSVLVELRFYTHPRERSGSAEDRRRAPSLPPSLVFQMVFLDEMEGVQEHTGTSPLELAHLSPLACGSINAAPTSSPGCISPLETGPSYTLRSILQSASSSSSSGEEMNALAGTMSQNVCAQARGRTRMGTSTRRTRARGRILPPAHDNILSELDTSPISPVSESSTSVSTSASASVSVTASASASTSVAAGSSASALTGADWGTLTSETSWQYELTRLRFENERMREEVRGLERVRGLGVAMGSGGLSVRGGGGGSGSGNGSVARRVGGGDGEDEGAGASYREGESPGVVGFIRGGGTSAMASLDLSRPDVMMAMEQQQLSLLPGVPQKRTRDGELKMPLA